MVVDSIVVDEEVDEVAAHRSLNPTELDICKHAPFLAYVTIVASFGIYTYMPFFYTSTNYIPPQYDMINLGGIIFGFDTAALNGILVMESFLKVMGREGKTSAEWAVYESWIVSSLLLACFFGAPFAAPLSDTYGRKWCIFIAMFITTVGTTIQAGASNFSTMIGGRIVVGVAIGLLSGIVPVYLAEVAPKSVRGSVGSFFYLTLAIGILFAFLVTLGLNQYSLEQDGTYKAENWRYILAIQASLAVFLMILMVPLTESPRWLVSVNKNEKAMAVLRRTRWNLPVGRRRNKEGEWVTITNVELEYDEIIDEVNTNEDKTAWYDFTCLLAPSVLLRTSMGILIQFFQQLSGINSFFYYSSVIYYKLGIVPDVTTAVTGAVSVAATLVAVFYIDRAGRRPLLIMGSMGMMLCLIVVGAIILFTDSQVSEAQRVAVTVFICFYIVNFSYSYGPIAWLYPPETFPLHLRAKGASISTAANWLADFIVAKSVPGMIQPESSVGGLGGLFIFFAGWSLVMTIWCMLNVHETMDLSLEKVNEVFGASTWREFYLYSAKNFRYTFYYGPKSMYEYTQEDKVPFGGAALSNAGEDGGRNSGMSKDSAAETEMEECSQHKGTVAYRNNPQLQYENNPMQNEC